MEYNVNSLGIQFNRFTNFTNPYFNNNFIPNTVNQTANQCFQCSDQPFIRTLLPPNLSTSHIQSTYNPRKLSFLKQPITASPATSTASTKLTSTFTIDSILDNNNKNIINCENSSTHSSQSNRQITDTIEDETNFDQDNEKTIFNWLRCTRYKPPKVKKRSISLEKRKAINRGPRIPFTSCQIRELETKFRDTHYLSSLEVTYLAQKLNLTDSRIRIWFQNRRARDKREKRLEDLPKEGEVVVDSSSAVDTITNTNSIYSTIDRKMAPLALQPNHSP